MFGELVLAALAVADLGLSTFRVLENVRLSYTAERDLSARSYKWCYGGRVPGEANTISTVESKHTIAAVPAARKDINISRTSPRD